MADPAARLVLRPPTASDIGDLHRLMSDPRVWTHLPHGRYEDEVQTRAMIERIDRGWAEHGQDHWIAHEAASGSLVGVGGPDLRKGVAWNLYYRLDPRFQGRGYAQEIAAAARARATLLRPELPMVASLLEHNVASRRTAERAGLSERWRGSDRDDPAAVHLLFADRSLPSSVVEAFAR